MDALYDIPLWNKEYVGMVDDILRMVTIQVTIQFLYYINSTETAFFTSDFFLLIVYVVLGVCLYWLVIKKLIHLVPSKEDALELK